MKIKAKLYASLQEYLPPNAVKQEAIIEVPDGATPSRIILQLGVPKEHCHLVLVNGLFVTDLVDLRIRGYRFHDGKDDLAPKLQNVFADAALAKETEKQQDKAAALEATKASYQDRNAERYVITFPYKQNLDFQTRLSVLRRIDDLCLSAA